MNFVLKVRGTSDNTRETNLMAKRKKDRELTSKFFDL